MKNKLIRIISFIIIPLILANCTTKQIPEEPIKHISQDIDNLNKFFKICNMDIEKAVKVIADNKMIGMLTYLKRMDMEGRKYYLLERENLTAMIKSVTEGTYSDLILINNSGVIIYTMINDDIFGKNVKTHLKDTALDTCFRRSSEIGFYIDDISFFPSDTGGPKLFASFPDKADNYTKGVFIMQIDSDIIEHIFQKRTIIIGRDGKYRIDKNRENILKPYEFFNKIDFENLNKSKRQFIQIENKNYIYYPFSYNSLSWIVFSEE